MSNWERAKIGDLCNTVSDTYRGGDSFVIPINTSDVYDGEILNHEMVENRGLKGQFKKTFLPDDILFSEIRPANKRFAYVDDEDTSLYIASTKLMVLRANQDRVLPKYLFAVLSSKDMLSELQLRAESRSGTFPQITFSGELAPIEIPLPDLATQRKIVFILDAIQRRIKINNRIQDILFEKAKAIFENKISQGTKDGNWRQAYLTDIANYLNGLAMQRYRPLQGEEGIPVLKIKELRQGFCDADSELCSPNIKKEYIVHDGDVIFSWSGSLLVDFWCGGTCGLNQHLFKVTSDEYAPWFFFAWTLHHLDSFKAVAAAKATTMGHIKRGDLDKAAVWIPPAAQYEEMERQIAPLYELVIKLRAENKSLERLRDAVTPKLISGHLDVSEMKLPAREAARTAAMFIEDAEQIEVSDER